MKPQSLSGSVAQPYQFPRASASAPQDTPDTSGTHRYPARSSKAPSIQLLRTSEAALVLAVPQGTLRQWRCLGIGPAFVKLGDGKKSAVRYAVRDVEEYIHERRHVPSVRANTRGMHERF